MKGLLFRALRLSLGYTMAEISRETGISSSVLSRVECEELEPSLRVLRGLGQFYGVCPGVMLSLCESAGDAGENWPRMMQVQVQRVWNWAQWLEDAKRQRTKGGSDPGAES